MLLCLFIQMGLLIVALRYYIHQEHKDEHRQSLFTAAMVLGVIMILLVIGNLLQVAIWAVLFKQLGEFSSFSAAYYHSAVNFATLGYGDIVMSEFHKLLGPLESINGIIMVGVSTAVLLAVFQDKLKKLSQLKKVK